MVGTISCSGIGSFTWIIEDFLSYILGTLDSPIFNFQTYSCRLFISESDGSTPYLKVRINCIKYDGLHYIYNEKCSVKLGMKTGLKGLIETRSGRTNKNGEFIVKRWMPTSELINRRCEILSNGVLTVHCELRLLSHEQENPLHFIPTIGDVEDKASDTDSPDQDIILPEEKCNLKLIQDLKSLMNSEEDCDVTLKVQEKEFRAHRVILRMRSPVFKSMFSHDMVEKESGVINLDDCNPDTLPDFLKYIYTGSTAHISLKNVFDLYTISDKYCIRELKEECAKFMKSNLSVKIFCDVLTIALRHDEKELIELATDLFCRDALEIVKTPKWQIFLRENSDVGNEIFIKYLSQQK